MYLLNLLAILLLIHNSAEQTNENVSGRIWGPGLEPHKLILPARYIFLETQIEDKIRNTSLPQNIDFKVIGSALDYKRVCRVWTNVLDRKDGSYILRYKLYEPCLNLQLHIKYNEEHLAESPYSFKQTIYPEKCMCAKGDVNTWLEEVKCGDIPQQIKSDLSLFKKINWDVIREKVIKTYNNPGAVSICHYIIKNNEIYRNCYGKYVGFKMFIDSILLSLTRKMNLPDLEFFMNLGDWPLVKEDMELFPIFSWCGSNTSFDIVMPTYDLTESTIENMGRVMLDMLSVQGNVGESWKNRIPKAFWRGRDSNIARLNLIDISRKHPNLFNVSLTNFFFYREQQDKYGPKTDHVSFYKFFDYKYQINIDGTVAAFRFPYLLAGGSLIFKQKSNYYEYFYPNLIEGKHYVPIESDLSDLIKQMKWYNEHDDKAKEIADNANKFANENLLPKNIYCYHAQLLREFSTLIESEIVVLEGMEKVEQPEDVKSCRCNGYSKDEL